MEQAVDLLRRSLRRDGATRSGSSDWTEKDPDLQLLHGERAFDRYIKHLKDRDCRAESSPNGGEK